MARVLIGTNSDGLLLESDPQTGIPDYVTVLLRNQGLYAAQRIFHGVPGGFRDLAEFFDKIARDWRGWAGTRSWESVEGDLRINARHAFGHIQLRVTLRKPGLDRGNDGWTATADLTLDPGEQMAHVASELAELATAEPGPTKE